MKVIDLTHMIESTMPVYPGTEPPTLVTANTWEQDGFKETRISMHSPPLVSLTHWPLIISIAGISSIFIL